MNSTAGESSFAPLEYYKKLTNCLAGRKNLKLNLSKIQGSRDFHHKTTPFITNRKIQAKFLAKYNLRKQFNENQREQQEKEASKQDEAIFKVKQNVGVNKKLKRKSDDESYINLPDSYFKAHPLPDLSLFKVTKVPPIKRQKIQTASNTIISNNFTLASLFSGNFNPPKCSTPIEQVKIPTVEEPHPIIADPNEILGSIENTHAVEKESQKAQEESTQLKKYTDLIDSAAKYLDSVFFKQSSDPVDAILKKLNKKYEEASQSPRTSLISSQGTKSSQIIFSQTPTENKKPASWPVPIFYDKPEEKVVEEFADIGDNLESLFEDTKRLRWFSDEEDSLDLGNDPFNLDETPKNSPNKSFWNSPDSFSKAFLASTMYSLTPYPTTRQHEECDELEWLERAFTTSMDMSWETGSNSSVATNRNNFNSDFSAIFRSPPKPNRLDLKERFSRTITSPDIFNQSNIEGFSDKDEDWWSTELNNTMNTFMPNKTSNFFDTNLNWF